MKNMALICMFQSLKCLLSNRENDVYTRLGALQVSIGLYEELLTNQDTAHIPHSILETLGNSIFM